MPRTETPIEQKIAAAIQSGNLSLLSRLINSDLRRNNWSGKSRLRCALYYRRLGADKKALKTLNVILKPALWDRCSDLELKLQVQAVQALCFLGATQIALTLAQRVPKSRRHLVLRQLSGIYFFCENHQSALDCNQEMLKLEGNKNAILHSTTLMMIGFSYGLLGDLRTAESILTPILSEQPENKLFQLNAHLCLLQSFICGEKGTEAEEIGRKALNLLDPDDMTPGPADVQEYYGASLVMLGRFKEAGEMLDKAFKRLYCPGRSPSSWIGVLYWKGLIEFRRKQLLPLEWIRVLVYPQCVRTEHQRMVPKKIDVPSSILVDVEGPTDNISNRLHYDIPSEMKILGHGKSSCRHELGFRLLDRALITLVLAGSFGISEYGFFEELWKDDFSVGQCQRRISQVVKRLRQEGYSIEWGSGQVWLKGKPNVTCRWGSETKPKGWAFLQEHPRFSRRDVQKFFSVSKNQAVKICSDWLAERVIARPPETALVYEVRKEKQNRH